jgi:hypothetical protein
VGEQRSVGSGRAGGEAVWHLCCCSRSLARPPFPPCVSHGRCRSLLDVNVLLAAKSLLIGLCANPAAHENTCIQVGRVLPVLVHPRGITDICRNTTPLSNSGFPLCMPICRDGSTYLSS